MIQKELVYLITNKDLGTRSTISKLKTKVIEQDKLVECCDDLVDKLALQLKAFLPLTAVCRSLFSIMKSYSKWEDDISDKAIVEAGIKILDWFAELNIITVQKQNMIVKNKVKPTWTLTCISKDFTEYYKSLPTDRFTPSVHNGIFKWEKPTAIVEDRRIELVKNSSKDKMLHHYTYNNMPSVYNSINRLNAQTYNINKDILRLSQGNNLFTPAEISKDDCRAAMKGLADVARKALWYEQARFLEHNKFIDKDDQPERRLSKKLKEYIVDKSLDYTHIIKSYSKWIDHNEILKLANNWQYKPINFIWSCDTRGRIYPIQNYLTPIGSDLAKAMLLFNEPQELDPEVLYIHIANCFGKDKISFEDRIKWVENNLQELYNIGVNPWNNEELIKKFGLQKEKKTKWQGLAALNELVNFLDYANDNNTQSGFQSYLPIGLDSTSSGTQILTMLTKDSEVAPYVNLTKSPDGKVGDFYSYLADFNYKLMKRYDSLIGLTPTMKEFISDEVWPIVKRITAKRNSMTFNYSGTRFGFGKQHTEDKKDYGPQGANEPSLGERILTNPDCFWLGKAMYKTCQIKIKGSAQLMNFLRSGVRLIKDLPAIISWKLPDGFVAYQRCAKSTSNVRATGSIGGINVVLRVYKYTDKGDLYEHLNGISANWTHSLDSLMLRLIVNNMPDEAPISTVHDQFVTSSNYINTLHSVARDSYKFIADRDNAADICESVFGVHRELPSVGNWNINDLDDAEFFIC